MSFALAFVVLLLIFILVEVIRIRVFLTRESPASRLRLALKFEDGRIEEDVMATQLTAVQKAEASVSPIDAKGNPASVQAGTVEWTSSNPAVITVTEDLNDETKAEIVAVGLGSAQVQIAADADLGDGVVTINGVADIEVIAAPAVGFAVNVGTPENQ